MAKGSAKQARVIAELEAARAAQELVKIVRKISGADRIDGYVVEIGRRWVLLAELGPGSLSTDLWRCAGWTSFVSSRTDPRVRPPANTQLTTATAPSLWVDPTDAVPPGEGDTVFTASAAASNELSSIRHDPTVSQEALLTARDEIQEAQLDLAHAAEEQAPGTHIPPGASPARKWADAYATLGERTTNAATTVPRSTVEQAANNYLSSEQTNCSSCRRRSRGNP